MIRINKNIQFIKVPKRRLLKCSSCIHFLLPIIIIYSLMSIDFSLLNDPNQSAEIQKEHHFLQLHNWRNLTYSEIDNLSVLGRRMYLNDSIGREQSKTFNILIWKTGVYEEGRMLYAFGDNYIDPFKDCSVSNCNFTYKDSDSDSVDAIVIHLHVTEGPQSFPNRTNFKQRWIWWSDESPPFTFMVAQNKNYSYYNGYFNWSMTYRMDSDVPVPYGRTVAMSYAEAALHVVQDYFKAKSKNVATMGSNCGGINGRWDYVKLLQKYMDVDVYGGCGTLECPGHFTRDCPLLNDYKFYLAFENGNCNEYITEKVFWNAISKGAVPVVMGDKIEHYRKILPPNSFIHVDEFDSPKQLAEYIMSVANSRAKYMAYHNWRLRYRVLNEHGYFQSDIRHYCRLCEALNYNDPAPKVSNMDSFLNEKENCYTTMWQLKNIE